MKRDRDEVAMESVNCLMLISRVGEELKRSSSGSREKMYKCKTCNREFNTFQALGGHRASHKKPRLDMPGLALLGLDMSDLLVKHKMHECSICGLEFPIGQALGGHMRRHRAEMVSEKRTVKKPAVTSKGGIMCLDLNLSPIENDLSLKLGLMAAACTVELV